MLVFFIIIIIIIILSFRTYFVQVHHMYLPLPEARDNTTLRPRRGTLQLCTV